MSICVSSDDDTRELILTNTVKGHLLSTQPHIRTASWVYRRKPEASQVLHFYSALSSSLFPFFFISPPSQSDHLSSPVALFYPPRFVTRLTVNERAHNQPATLAQPQPSLATSFARHSRSRRYFTFKTFPRRALLSNSAVSSPVSRPTLCAL